MPRLYTRIYLHALGVLLVAGLVTSVTLSLGVRSEGLREIAERLVHHATSLVGEHFREPAQLERRLKQLHVDLDFDVTVRDLDGRVVAVAGTPLPAPSAAELAALRAGAVLVHARPSWAAAAPVREPGSRVVIGVVQVSARRPAGWPALLWPLLIVSAVLLAVGVASAPLARRISRPLERLAEAARRVGGGDLAARAPAAEMSGPHRWLRGRRNHVEELQELTRAFNDMADRIERLVRGQKDLLSNVSHELRSPLARIRVALELLPRDGEADARLGEVERDLEELDRLIDDVLTGARLEATGLGSRLAPVDVRPLLEEVAERARHDPLTADREVRVAGSPKLDVTGDAALLRRALWNLVENAAKYGAPPIMLEARVQEGDILLSVSDNGAGIDPDERDRVLGPFHRQDKTRTPSLAGGPSRGFGLGLTLARQIALAHGGAIVIGAAATDGPRERGCRVTIRIPARPRPPGDATPHD